MAASEKKPAKLKKRLPQTPVRPKVVTKHMTPREAAQWLAPTPTPTPTPTPIVAAEPWTPDPTPTPKIIASLAAPFDWTEYEAGRLRQGTDRHPPDEESLRLDDVPRAAAPRQSPPLLS